MVTPPPSGPDSPLHTEQQDETLNLMLRTQVTNHAIHYIAEALIPNSALMKILNQFAGALGLTTAEYVSLKNEHQHNNYGIVQAILEEWISRKEICHTTWFTLYQTLKTYSPLAADRVKSLFGRKYAAQLGHGNTNGTVADPGQERSLLLCKEVTPNSGNSGKEGEPVPRMMAANSHRSQHISRSALISTILATLVLTFIADRAYLYSTNQYPCSVCMTQTPFSTTLPPEPYPTPSTIASVLDPTETLSEEYVTSQREWATTAEVKLHQADTELLEPKSAVKLSKTKRVGPALNLTVHSVKQLRKKRRSCDHVLNSTFILRDEVEIENSRYPEYCHGDEHFQDLATFKGTANTTTLLFIVCEVGRMVASLTFADLEIRLITHGTRSTACSGHPGWCSADQWSNLKKLASIDLSELNSRCIFELMSSITLPSLNYIRISGVEINEYNVKQIRTIIHKAASTLQVLDFRQMQSEYNPNPKLFSLVDDEICSKFKTGTKIQIDREDESPGHKLVISNIEVFAVCKRFLSR